MEIERMGEMEKVRRTEIVREMYKEMAEIAIGR
jgi:hypothetical protein